LKANYKKKKKKHKFWTVLKHPEIEKKPYGNNSSQFIMDGLKPSRTKSREMNFWVVWAKPSGIPDGFTQTVQIQF